MSREMWKILECRVINFLLAFFLLWINPNPGQSLNTIYGLLNIARPKLVIGKIRNAKLATSFESIIEEPQHIALRRACSPLTIDLVYVATQELCRLLAEQTVEDKVICLIQNIRSWSQLLPAHHIQRNLLQQNYASIIPIELTLYLYLPYKPPINLMLRCYLQETWLPPTKLLVIKVSLGNSELLLHPILLTLLVISPLLIKTGLTPIKVPAGSKPLSSMVCHVEIV